jgi:diguanylate cyclase (GGDEF)-like protein
MCCGWENALSLILIVEDDCSIADLVSASLHSQGYDTLISTDGEQGFFMAIQMNPHLILLDVGLPKLDGMGVCHKLRSMAKTRDIPIIMLTASAATVDKLKALNMGADDYITKPFDVDELLARVQAQLRRANRNLFSSLTGMVGNLQIEEALKELVTIKSPKWAVAYFDIDNFKGYNDTYGFLKGNEVIQITAQVIRDALEQSGSRVSFEMGGHIGGDDFVVITSADHVESLCQKILHRFDERVSQFYEPLDRERGYVLSQDRKGNFTRLPLITLSAGIVTNQQREIESHWTIGAIAAEVKRKAKALPGSAYYLDRRR